MSHRYQATGSLRVEAAGGFDLVEGDLRILYDFEKGGSTPQHYDAHSDGKVRGLVLALEQRYLADIFLVDYFQMVLVNNNNIESYLILMLY